MDSDEHTCIVCYATAVDTPINCCKKPICDTCWNNSINISKRCPHCRTLSNTQSDILRGNGISNHSIIIGNSFEETIANILIWNEHNIKPAIVYAYSEIEHNGNRGNITIRIIEDSKKHKVIEDQYRVERNIIYYHMG